jgi:hypothetical protein
MATPHRSATATPALRIVAARDSKKYSEKRTNTLTPWLDEALPGPAMGNILKQHVEHLEYQALVPTPTPNPLPTAPRQDIKKNTLEKAPSPSPLGFMKPFPSP